MHPAANGNRPGSGSYRAESPWTPYRRRPCNQYGTHQHASSRRASAPRESTGGSPRDHSQRKSGDQKRSQCTGAYQQPESYRSSSPEQPGRRSSPGPWSSPAWTGQYARSRLRSYAHRHPRSPAAGRSTPHPGWSCLPRSSGCRCEPANRCCPARFHAGQSEYPNRGCTPARQTRSKHVRGSSHRTQ